MNKNKVTTNEEFIEANEIAETTAEVEAIADTNETAEGGNPRLKMSDYTISLYTHLHVSELVRFANIAKAGEDVDYKHISIKETGNAMCIEDHKYFEAMKPFVVNIFSALHETFVEEEEDIIDNLYCTYDFLPDGMSLPRAPLNNSTVDPIYIASVDPIYIASVAKNLATVLESEIDRIPEELVETYRRVLGTCNYIVANFIDIATIINNGPNGLIGESIENMNAELVQISGLSKILEDINDEIFIRDLSTVFADPTSEITDKKVIAAVQQLLIADNLIRCYNDLIEHNKDKMEYIVDRFNHQSYYDMLEVFNAINDALKIYIEKHPSIIVEVDGEEYQDE